MLKLQNIEFSTHRLLIKQERTRKRPFSQPFYSSKKLYSTGYGRTVI